MAAPQPNPNDNDSYLVYIPSIIFLVISPIVVALRIWARLRQGGSMGADDWTALVALVTISKSDLLATIYMLTFDFFSMFLRSLLFLQVPFW